MLFSFTAVSVPIETGIGEPAAVTRKAILSAEAEVAVTMPPTPGAISGAISGTQEELSNSAEELRAWLDEQGHSLVGHEVLKQFDDGQYFGVVTSYLLEEKWYRVEYEDGDMEDLTWDELEPVLKAALVYRKRNPDREGLARRRSKGKKRHSLPAESVETGAVDDAVEDTSSIPDDVDGHGGGEKLVGMEVKKFFGNLGDFSGKVISYDPKFKYYKVHYEDDDEEELTWKELKPIIIAVAAPSGKAKTTADSKKRKGKATPSKTPEKKGATPKKTTPEKKVTPRKRGRKSEGEACAAVELGEEEETGRGHRVRRAKRPHDVDVLLQTTPRAKEGKQGAAAMAGTPSESSRKRAVKEKDERSAFRRSLVREMFGRPLAAPEELEGLEFLAWGEAAWAGPSDARVLPALTAGPVKGSVTYLAASQHHLAAVAAGGQVFVWRNAHGGPVRQQQQRCNVWECVEAIAGKVASAVDIAGPSISQSAGSSMEAEGEEQLPDPFYLGVVTKEQDYLFQSSCPAEKEVRVCPLNSDYLPGDLASAIRKADPSFEEDVGRVVAMSVGTVKEEEEPPFVGYITENDQVFIRGAFGPDFAEAVHLLKGFTGKPVKFKCGSSYFAILLTDNGKVWTWDGQTVATTSTGDNGAHSSSSSSLFEAGGSLTDKFVVDVSCWGEQFVAVTDEGQVHLWSRVYLISNRLKSQPIHIDPDQGIGPKVPGQDKVLHVVMGAGMCTAVTSKGKLHTWRMNCPEGVPRTPMGRKEDDEERSTEMKIPARVKAVKEVLCVPGSLIVVAVKRLRFRQKEKAKTGQAEEEEGGEAQQQERPGTSTAGAQAVVGKNKTEKARVELTVEVVTTTAASNAGGDVGRGGGGGGVTVTVPVHGGSETPAALAT